MSRRIIGATVGTPLSPAKIADKIKLVKTVNGVAPDQSGNVSIAVKDGKTPVKGKDYFTQADKDEVIGAAVESVPMEWLDYIESDGMQYIDTGFIPNSNTKVVMDAQFMDVGTRGALFGARTSATEKAYMMARVSNGTKIRSYYFDYTDDNGENVEWQMDGLDETIYIMDKNVASVNGVGFVSTEQNFSCKLTMFLMALHTEESAKVAWHSKLRVYSCQIYDNGTLIRDFVPVRTVTGLVGLFDKVHNKLYTDANGGEFTAAPSSNSGSSGNVVDIPTPDYAAAEGEPGHILNRTHWVETGTVELPIPAGIWTADDDARFFMMTASLGLVAGKTYTVNWNGVDYEVVAADMTETFGSPAVALSSEHFEIADAAFDVENGVYGMVASYDGTEATFSIYGDGEIVHKLDSKYLPMEDIVESVISALPNGDEVSY